MKTKRRGSGQSLLEFALILPLLMLVIVFFIELARLIYFQSALNNAVREGARFAIVNPFDDTPEAELLAVQERVTHFAIALPLNVDDVSVYCDRLEANGYNSCEDHVTVSAEMEIEPMVGFFALLMGGGSTYNIAADSTMQMTAYGAQ